MRAMAEEEIASAEAGTVATEAELQRMLLPKDLMMPALLSSKFVQARAVTNLPLFA
jgi:protein subunit release factor A